MASAGIYQRPQTRMRAASHSAFVRRRGLLSTVLAVNVAVKWPSHRAAFYTIPCETCDWGGRWLVRARMTVCLLEPFGVVGRMVHTLYADHSSSRQAMGFPQGGTDSIEPLRLHVSHVYVAAQGSPAARESTGEHGRAVASGRSRDASPRAIRPRGGRRARAIQ